jgi:hypothetical protein
MTPSCMHVHHQQSTEQLFGFGSPTTYSDACSSPQASTSVSGTAITRQGGRLLLQGSCLTLTLRLSLCWRCWWARCLSRPCVRCLKRRSWRL